MVNFKVEKVSPLLKYVTALFKLLDEHNLSHCPPEICNLIQPEEMLHSDFVLFGVIVNEAVVSIGGLKFYKEFAEITRMYTRKESRGNGFSKIILMELENAALAKGLLKLKLETSEEFKEAVSLYVKTGFTRCEPFGDYKKKPFNT